VVATEERFVVAVLISAHTAEALGETTTTTVRRSNMIIILGLFIGLIIGYIIHHRE